ncbi:MAG: hypothetical protein HZA54_08935 [Planctomycetes bacterium]|nr:hypothetical protein [Planctomycetota bacterium]
MRIPPAKKRPVHSALRPPTRGEARRGTALLGPVRAEDLAVAARARGVVERVLKAAEEGRPADRILAQELRAGTALAPADARFVSRLAFAAFRWRGWTRLIPASSPGRALFLAYWLDGGPEHPALRAWAPEKTLPRIAADAAPAARAAAFARLTGVTPDPAALVPSWFADLTDGPVADLVESFTRPPALWVRACDTAPAAVAALVLELGKLGVSAEPHPVLTGALRVASAVSLYEIPPFRTGRIEVQDLASQAVGAVCAPAPRERWWDACAGAGGKTLDLATRMGGKGTVVATDAHARKLDELRRRARRAGLSNISPREWDGKGVAGTPRSYDGVLVDAPCSASGTWRRNPDARWRTRPEAVAELARAQAALLRAAAAGVKPGGLLVYAVCSLLRPETSDVVAAFLALPDTAFTLDPIPHPLTAEPTDGRIWIWPHRADSDGMFIARMRRKKP